MNHLTRSATAALCFGIPALVTISVIRGQQSGIPSAYPQTSAQQQSTTSPYPVTSAPNPAQQQPLDQQPLQQEQSGAPQSIAPQPPAAQAAPQMPPGFPLNQLEEQSLDIVLNAWQTQSAKVTTFSCPFERLEYVMAFGPVINGASAPLNKNQGELTYSKPDKGSFEITKICTYKQLPPPANQPNAAPRGDWLEQKEAIGEHWVCDGKSVYEFRSDQKQVIERPLPPNAAGEAILDGPLPFIFGAEAAKMKARYWMRVDDTQGGNPKPNPNQVWIYAWPKQQAQAADFRQVDVILDRNKLLPQAMRVTLPNNDQHVYKFDLDRSNVNGVLNQIQQALFSKPRTPFGWKHVLEQTPVAQAPQPGQQQSR
jgi:TIGR03009 family protein